MRSTAARRRRRPAGRTLGALAAALAAVALAGCGEAENTSGGTDGTVTLWTHNAGNPAELAVVQSIVDGYNASQDTYTVTVEAFPQESYNSAVVGAATADKLPCILDVDAPTVPNWAYAGYLAPLDLPPALVEKSLDGTKGFFQDQLYSIGLYDAALAIFARRSALSDAGVRIPSIENPWSGEEFDEALARIKERGDFPFPFDLGTGDRGTEWWTYGYSPFLQSFGGDLIDRDTFRTAEGFINGEEAVAWGTWMQGLVEKGYVPARSGTDAFADFVNGRSAMVWSGIWNSENLEQLGEDGITLPPPDLGNGPTIGAGSWQWAVSETCPNRTAAMDWIEFALQPEYLSMMVREQSVVPATVEAAAMTPGWEPGSPKRFFLESSERFAVIRPPTPGYPFLTSTFAKAAQDVMSGGDVQEILDQAASDIDDNLRFNEFYGF
jgi:multiple sugar transport system substrate-binding protein